MQVGNYGWFFIFPAFGLFQSLRRGAGGATAFTPVPLHMIVLYIIPLHFNVLHCVKINCTVSKCSALHVLNTVYSAPWTSMALLLHCGWPALPPLLQCSGLNLFIGLTVGHYMQLVQGSRPRHYMQWPTTVGVGHCQTLFWLQ